MRSMAMKRQAQLAYVAEGELVPAFDNIQLSFPEGAVVFESGSWSMKWQDGATCGTFSPAPSLVT